MSDASTKPRKLPDAATVDLWMAAASEHLSEYEPLINRINVFPVRDRDTGSNLRATLEAASAACGEAGLQDTWGARLSATARAASASALGNSGTVVVIILSTLGERLADVKRLDAVSWSAALAAADVRASSAISDRAPASLFDVLAAAASCPPREDSGFAGLADLIDAQVAAAWQAVRETYSGSELLAKFDVLDAGALGFLILFESFRSVVTGEPFRESLLRDLPGTVLVAEESDEGQPEEAGVEVVCTVRANPLDAAVLRADLDAVGESVIMTPLEGQGSAPGEPVLWRIHVHAARESDALDIISEVSEAQDVTVSSLSSIHEDC